jgi:nucleoside-diphosphate-sugar epimerase
MHTILVTGGSGFIGGNFIGCCHKTGYNVRAALRRQTRLPCPTIMVGNVDGNTAWSKALQDVDTVVHLAAYAHFTNAARLDNDQLRKVNIDGTVRLAQQSASLGVRHFVFISSIGAMAEFSDSRLTVETPCEPSTTYGKSKLEAELALKQIAVAGGMAWTIIRPPLVYGPGNPGNMERLQKLVRSGLPLPLASVHNRRSFIYVENLVDLITACLGNPKAFGKTFLPSDGDDLSTAELIEKIARAETRNLSRRQAKAKPECSGGGCAARRARLFPFPESILKALGRLPGLGALRKLTSSLYVDSEPIRRDLGWSPPFTMEEGLRRTLVIDNARLD